MKNKVKSAAQVGLGKPEVSGSVLAGAFLGVKLGLGMGCQKAPEKVRKAMTLGQDSQSWTFQ